MVCVIMWRKAVGVVRNGTVGRICKSAPTGFVNSMVQADIAFCNVRYAIKLKFCTASRRLTYWLNRRFYLCNVGTFSTAPNGLVQNRYNHPVRLSPATLPKEGNGPPECVASAKIKSYTIHFMETKTKWRKRFCSCKTAL